MNLADDLDGVSGLQLLLNLRDDLVDIFRNAAEITVLHAGIDVIHRLNVGLVQIGRNAVALERRHVAQEARDRRPGRGDRGRDRGIADVAERTHQMLRRLHRDVIGDPTDRIGPEIGYDLFR